MIPNINQTSGARKTPKRGRKPRFDPAIFEERFNTIERLFGWEDKCRRLLLRFPRLSQLHYAFKTLTSATVDLQTHASRSLTHDVRIPHVHCMAVLYNHRQTSLK